MLEEIFTQDFVVRSAAASIIIIFGLISARYVAQFGGWVLRKINQDKEIAYAFEETVKSALRYAVYGLAIIAALNRLGLASTVFSIVILVVTLIVALVLFLVLRDLITNLFSGLLIKNKNLIKPGKYLVVGDSKGTVTKVSATGVTLETKDGGSIVIPNLFLSKNKFAVHNSENKEKA